MALQWKINNVKLLQGKLPFLSKFQTFSHKKSANQLNIWNVITG